MKWSMFYLLVANVWMASDSPLSVWFSAISLVISGVCIYQERP